MKRFKSIKGHQYDTKTGLLWHRETEMMDWEEAAEYAKALTELGLKWRVPSVEELLSIVDYGKYKPATKLKEITPSYYWSSSPFVSNPANAWAVYFGAGYADYYIKSDDNYVRCVAGSEEFEYFKNRAVVKNEMGFA